MLSAEEWINQLDLQPHPEGGWFREVYRSKETITQSGLPERFSGERNFCTSIYFLLNQTDTSAFHRIKQDEIWHFYAGNALTIHMISPDGNYSSIVLGQNIQSGENLMAVVEAGWWFGASLNDTSSYCLVGCTVAPGFEFDDFEMPSSEDLVQHFPQHQAVIEQLSS